MKQNNLYFYYILHLVQYANKHYLYNEQPIQLIVRHVSAIRRAFEEKYGADYWNTIAKTSAPVLRYHLYHLVEEDWLTYYLVRIALNMTPEETREELNR